MSRMSFLDITQCEGKESNDGLVGIATDYPPKWKAKNNWGYQAGLL